TEWINTVASPVTQSSPHEKLYQAPRHYTPAAQYCSIAWPGMARRGAPVCKGSQYTVPVLQPAFLHLHHRHQEDTVKTIALPFPAFYPVRAKCRQIYYLTTSFY